jgi:hypothetical protein
MNVDSASTVRRRLLADHVADFNRGVQSGDFSPMTARLSERATMYADGTVEGAG